MAPGRKTGGRTKGTRNKATVERDAQAALVQERLAEIARLEAAGVNAVEAAKQTTGSKLMKDVAVDFAKLFTNIAAHYQPYPGWRPLIDGDRASPNFGKPVMNPRTGQPVLVNDNPNFDEAKFKEWSALALQAALGAAPYQSPRFSAMMIGATVVQQIEVVGGLPDDEGEIIDARPNEPDRLAGPGADQGPGSNPAVSPGPGAAVEDAGEVQSGPLRKTLG